MLERLLGMLEAAPTAQALRRTGSAALEQMLAQMTEGGAQ